MSLVAYGISVITIHIPYFIKRGQVWVMRHTSIQGGCLFVTIMQSTLIAFYLIVINMIRQVK